MVLLKCVYVRECASGNALVWAYVHTCVCMAACQAVPSGCLTEPPSLTGRLIAVAAPKLCQTSPWGHGGNRLSTCWCIHMHQHRKRSPKLFCGIKKKKHPSVNKRCHEKRVAQGTFVLVVRGHACVSACAFMSGYMHVYIILMNYALLL